MPWNIRKPGGWGPSEGDDEGPTRWSLTTTNIIHTILEVVAGGIIRAGKTAYTDDTNTGFWLGVDTDGLAKLNLGSTNFYLKWTGTKLEIAGSLRTKNSYVQIIDDSTEDYGEGVTLLQGDWLTSGALRWKSSAGYVGGILTGVNNGAASTSVILYAYPRVTGAGKIGAISLAAYNKAFGEAGAAFGGLTLNSNKVLQITGELEITGNTKDDVQLLIWCPADQAVDIIQVLDADEHEQLSLDKDGILNTLAGYAVAGTQVITTQQAAITDAKTDYAAGDLDSEAEIISALNATNTTLNSILSALRTHGLIAG